MSDLHKQIDKLYRQGVLGFYKGLEVVTIFGCYKNGAAFNVLTIINAVDNEVDISSNPEFINDKPIKIQDLKDYSFGVMRYFIDIDSMLASLQTLKNSQVWNASGQDLQTDSLIEMPQTFIPSNSTVTVPLNNILKNNFFEGSHIFEWFDVIKSNVNFLFKNPTYLQVLSEEINKYIPLKIAFVSDRLGNLILQLPVTIIPSVLNHTKRNNYLKLELAWHKNFEHHKRELTFVLIKENDKTIPDIFVENIHNDYTELKVFHDYLPHKYYILDNDNQIVLKGSSETGFINSINFKLNMMNPEPRVFNTIQHNQVIAQRVGIEAQQPSLIEDNEASSKVSGYQRNRLFSEERFQLLASKEFVEYKPGDNERAISDIRTLIRKHGSKGAWLMDPFLSAEDILSTLFFSQHSDAPLLAISGLEQAPNGKDSKYTKRDLINYYSNILNSNCGNKAGLSLEFRAKINNFGYPFHDRFLIFPNEEFGAIAWSLGTSINGLGNKHHIFQKVSYGQMIADTFEELWRELDHKDCLVWKA